MPAKQAFTFSDPEGLKAVVAERLGLDSGGLEARLLTPDFYGEVWKVESRDAAYIARLCALSTDSPYLSAKRFIQGVALEPVRLEFIKEYTSVPVPNVYFFEPHSPTLHCSLTLTENLPGRHLHQKNQEDWDSIVRAYARSIGRGLKDIHALSHVQFGQEGNAVGLHDSWADVFQILWEGLIKEVCYDPALVQRFFDAYERMRPSFEDIPTASLLHGHLHQSNFLLDPSGTVTGVIDWVDSLWGDPLWDLVYLKFSNALGVSFFVEYPEAKIIIQSKAGLIRGCFYGYFIYLERILKAQKVDANTSDFLRLVVEKLEGLEA